MKAQVSDRGVKAKSKQLAKRRIALAVCGGIGAVDSIKIIRELRRHGAEVTPFLTPSATDFITPLSLEWASHQKGIDRLGAGAEHLEPFDLVVIAPATLNTIAKCALGIADNAVTTLVAAQLGRHLPILVVPTMNVQLQNHPAYKDHRERLMNWGTQFLESPPEEDRIKMPELAELLGAVVQCLK
ncbi:MAG: hypothetical protein HY537_00825 [Deltaproteobacteria bacterium]|nr:hypothetical protein [Deltaproteobacteria bacterium]